MLAVRNLHVSYGAITALHGINLDVPEGKIVTLLGANGAGKSTALRAISGLVPSTSGNICYEGEEISLQPAHKIVARGLSHVPEGRMIFANLTVRENLLMGSYLQKDKSWIAKQILYVFELFPILKSRESQLAGTLSGGEQQMLAIGRALLSRPNFLMLDEPSLGIAPLLVRTIFERVVEINRSQNMTILLVEQNANLALDISSYGYVMETGRLILEGPAAKLKANPKVQAAYLGY